MFLSDVSIKRPVFATMMMVALVVFGVVGYSRLAVDEYPDVSYPVISVNTNYPGASPEVVEREITRPIEQALNTVDGLNEITSTSSEGSSSVRLNFNLGVDPVRMQPEISVKVGRIRRQLPRDILDPQIMRFDPNDSPVMTIALQSRTRTLRARMCSAPQNSGTSVIKTVPPERISMSAARPSEGFAEIPEKPSDPPHSNPIHNLLSGAGIRCI